MRIAYCTNNIEGLGGFEKVTILKANALSEIAGNEVFVIVTDHKGEKSMLAQLNTNVTFINLNINYYDDDWKPGLLPRFQMLRKRILHKNLLKKKLDIINPDIAIGTGRSEKFFLRKGYLKNVKTVIVREIHSASNYRNILATTFSQRILARIFNLIDHKVISRFYYDAIVCLTAEDKLENWKGVKNVYAIPNPLTISTTYEKVEKRKVVVAVGRLSSEKNFESLLRIFSNVINNNHGWSLEIYGEGPEKHKLATNIKKLNLENYAFLKGQSTKISDILSSSSILALTSSLEGFALVLVEAMSRAMPVISYDCTYGPSSIISNMTDGFLIKENDEEEFALKLSLLMSNETLRLEMGKNAYEKSKQYHPEVISKQWMDLFHNLINSKS